MAGLRSCRGAVAASGHLRICDAHRLPGGGWPVCQLSAHRNEAVTEVPREESRRWQKLGAERRKGPPRLLGFAPDHLGEEAAGRFAE